MTMMGMDFMSLDTDVIQAVFGSLQTQFFQTLALFTAAAWIHGRQVRTEIKKQMGLLVEVLQQDLTAQKEVLASLTGRIDRIEEHLNIKGE